MSRLDFSTSVSTIGTSYLNSTKLLLTLFIFFTLHKMSAITNIETIVSTLSSLFRTNKTIEFVYLFGSFAKNKTSPISDLDVAVYLNDTSEALSDWQFRIELIEKIMDACKINNVDLIYLNDCPIVLKYEVLKHGILVNCKNRDKRIDFFQRTVKEYCDTNFLRDFHLNAAQKRMKTGEKRGCSPGFAKSLDSIRGLFDEAEGV